MKDFPFGFYPISIKSLILNQNFIFTFWQFVYRLIIIGNMYGDMSAIDIRNGENVLFLLLELNTSKTAL
jgi:hypothetical protein